MEAVLWLFFVLSALIMVVVVLLQEPKGGGLAEAFGGMGAQTFGVKATGITKFTVYVAAVFLISGILLTCNKMSSMQYQAEPAAESVEEGGGGTGGTEAAPADAGGEGAAEQGGADQGGADENN